jgi:dGTPase
MSADRDDRYFTPRKRGPKDVRRPSQSDRDRILYSSAFRRLAGITQVVAPAEGQVFHNRLTHTLEVAQIGRRLAEKLLHEYDREFIDSIGGINPDVVEAAALAHDLGHPPFGHIAEETLCKLLDGIRSSDYPGTWFKEGFEGNAQSFRIVTTLALRYPPDSGRSDEIVTGLNLTRATLRLRP